MSQRTNQSRRDCTGRLSETEFLAAIVESSSDAIVGKTLDGVITSWNRGAEHMYGYAAAEAIGQPISLIIPTHRIEEFAHILEGIRRGERVEHYETERLAKAGQIIRVSLSVSPVRDRTGKLIGAAAIARDISHLRKTEAALAESERRYHSLVETAVHGIYRATLEGRFLEVNPTLLRLLGYEDDDEVLRLSIPADVFVHAPAHAELIAACLQGKGAQQDVRWKRKDGKQITMRLAAHVVFSDPQATVEVIAEDVSLHREFERKLQQLERTELLGQLAGGIAHNFNNYLNVIMGHEFLLSSAIGATEDLHHHLLEIRKAAQHAADLSKRLISLGKKEPGLSTEEVDPSAVVRDVEAMLKGVLPANISFTLDLSPQTMKVRAAAGEIQHMVVNLVLNARDAMPNGGQIEITSGYRTFKGPTRTIAGDYLSGDYIFLRVADTGHGMDIVTATHALEPFFTTKPEGKGTGLGLSSIYATLKRHGGSLDIATEVGQGTRVTIFLPLAVGQPAEESAVEPSRTTPKTVLVVDDDNGVRPVMVGMLSAAGFRVIQSSTGKDARAVFEQEKIDVILCDLHLANVSPRELLEGFRWLLGTTRIIVISGGELTEDEQRRFQPGIFLQKPFSTAQLLTAVRGQIEAT